MLTCQLHTGNISCISRPDTTSDVPIAEACNTTLYYWLPPDLISSVRLLI